MKHGTNVGQNQFYMIDSSWRKATINVDIKRMIETF
jgi:hypothetical protein